MKITQTITKSLGILALILALAFSMSAQSIEITTTATGKKPNDGLKATTQLSYNSGTKAVTIKVTDIDGNSTNLRFSRVGISNIGAGSSGGYRALPSSYTLNQPRSFYPETYGFSGVCKLIIRDLHGKYYSMNFYVN